MGTGLLHFFLAKLIRSDGKSSARLSLRFKSGSPDKVNELSASEPVLQSFCFPLGTDAVAPKERFASEEYCFTLTNGDGSRVQGFCRVVLPPAPKVGTKLRYPWVLCIMSEFPWSALYSMVLQTIEQLLRSDEALDTDLAELPPSSLVGTFLDDLAFQLNPDPEPGSIIKVPLPNAAGLLGTSPSLTLRSHGTSLYKDDWIELPVPADCGNGKLNCGISLARLLWHVPVSSMLQLIASMLLEHRIVMTSRSRDTLTAAVQAAAALLYPFKFHHIFLPLLPKMLKDYLQAPMPFLVGLPDQMLGLLNGMYGMDEVTLVDLDQGKVYPYWKPGTPVAGPSPHDDSALLPWRDELEAALSAAYSNLKSPTEYEQSSPFITGIMQEYFLKLLGNYRSFLHEDTPLLNAHFAAHFHAAAAGSGGSSASLSSPVHKRESRRSSHPDQQDPCIKGHGHVFEHSAFVAHHRRNAKARAFLSLFRHSQMYEMFIQERLQLAAQRYETDDPFEARLLLFQQRQMSAASKQGPKLVQSKLAGMFRKHRRTGSVEFLTEANSSDVAMRRITTEPELQATLSPASFFQSELDLEFLDSAFDLKTLPDSPDTQRGNASLQKMSAPLSAKGKPAHQQLQAPGQSQPQPQHALSRGLSAPLDLVTGSPAAPSVGAPESSTSRGGGGQQQAEGVSPQQPAATHLPTSVSTGPSASAAAAPTILSQHKNSGVASSLQSGKKQLEATKDAVKEMWSHATQQMRRSVGGNGTAAVRKPETTTAVRDGAGSSAREEAADLAPGPSASDHVRPKPLKGPDEGKPRASLLQRYLPHGTVGVGVVQSLLEGSKLKHPPAPVRPLHVAQPPAQPRLEDQAAASTKNGQQSAACPPRASHDSWDPFGLSFR